MMGIKEIVSSTVSIYNCTTNSSVVGNFSLTVNATDIQGNSNKSVSIPLTVTSDDITPPVITSPTATPSSIPPDGTTTSQLSVTVTDNVGIASVTVDLSALGGSATTTMTRVGTTDVYRVTTNAATSTTPGSYSLTVTATDSSANANTSVSIPLTVKAVPASTTSFSIENPTASRAQNFTARISMNATVDGWYVVVVSGTESGGESIAGVGTVYLAAGQSVTDMPIIVHIPSQATAGTYTLYAGAYAMDDYPANLGNIIEHEGPVTVTVA